MIDFEDTHQRDEFGDNEPSFHADEDGAARPTEAVVAFYLDDGLVESDVPVMTSFLFCTCGAEHFVLPKRAAALAASRVDFWMRFKTLPPQALGHFWAVWASASGCFLLQGL